MSCGCSHTGYSRTVSIKDILGSKTKRELVMDTTYLSRKKFVEKDPLTLLKFARAIDKELFDKTFENEGIIITEDEHLEILAEMWKTGGDKAGELKSNNGEKRSFSVEEIFSKINVDLSKLSEAKIKFD